MFVRIRGQGGAKSYLEKGIRVCPEWYDYVTFKKWALKNGFQPNNGLVLDRVNNNENYGPDNCQWLTKSEHGAKSLEERNAANT